ncbi:hypothetical protein BSL78_03007 [Apostichopus japonicus]|uniref:Uncharacterized protein n=1 Tax=Stichopus japonicus TaxID=307972 RepID=A0A2G8LIQ6_STIJA|nr:hypothetical protein BSL78_03007 [Apostichopus japonicus]
MHVHKYYINSDDTLGSNLSARLDNSAEKVELRERRSSDTPQDASTVADMSTLMQSQSNFQSAYFLGQCLMCPPGKRRKWPTRVMAGAHYNHAGGLPIIYAYPKILFLMSRWQAFSTTLFSMVRNTRPCFTITTSLTEFRSTLCCVSAPARTIILMVPGRTKCPPGKR